MLSYDISPIIPVLLEFAGADTKRNNAGPVAPDIPLAPEAPIPLAPTAPVAPVGPVDPVAPGYLKDKKKFINNIKLRPQKQRIL